LQPTPEEEALLAKYLWFYEALDKKRRPPATEAQRHFIEACRCTTPPITTHEVAYLKYRAQLASEELALREVATSATPEYEDGYPSPEWSGQRFEPEKRYSIPPVALPAPAPQGAQGHR
jgi:uncharacterized protein YifE (UPF0438 family)